MELDFYLDISKNLSDTKEVGPLVGVVGAVEVD